MDNGAYVEIKRLLREGGLSEEETQRVSIELLFDIRDRLKETQRKQESHDGRLSSLEENPSITQMFRDNPKKTVGAVVGGFMGLEIIAQSTPNALSWFFGLLGG
jgi:hypothetical protein